MWPVFRHCFVTADFSSSSNLTCEKFPLNFKTNPEVSSCLSKILVLTNLPVNLNNRIDFYFPENLNVSAGVLIKKDEGVWLARISDCRSSS